MAKANKNGIPKVTGTTLQEVLVSLNKTICSLYAQNKVLEKKVSDLTRGDIPAEKSQVGAIRLVENKKGTNKYQLEVKFKDGVKLLDASFIDK